MDPLSSNHSENKAAGKSAGAQQPDKDILARYVSELGCLYAIEKLVSSEGDTTDVVLESAARILPRAVHDFDHYAVRITARDRMFPSESFKESGWLERFPIKAHGKELGRIEYFRMSPPPNNQAALLCESEKELIVTIADRLGNFLDQWETRQKLRISTEMLRAQYQFIPIPTVTWRRRDDDFYLTDYNDAALEITRGGISTMIGKTARNVFPDYPVVHEVLSYCLQKRTCVRREMPFRFQTTGEKKFLSVI
ncbi:MAG: hypothetical protein V2A34_14890, partial [Lentisphaerota bacterium]